MAQTTELPHQRFHKVVVIHNSDMSGPVTIRWWARSDDRAPVGEVSIPEGIIPALFLKFFLQEAVGLLESFAEDAVRRFESRLKR